MSARAPRFVLGGTGSGCGKTTMTCALLQAYTERGLDTAAFKCGPDYIDPMFHSRVIGARARNLDAFLCGREQIPALFRNSAGRDLSVIEGVMGYYDGIGSTSENSTCEIARLTGSPTVLVVPAKGMALSLAALTEGFLRFEENTIRGVLLNGVSPSLTDYYAGMVERHTGLRVYGALPHDSACEIRSRHLGLVTAGELPDLREKMRRLAAHAREGVNLDGLLALARTAPEVDGVLSELPRCGEGLRIGLARDEAFCFDYADSLDVLTRMGASLVPFSPLHDTRLPDDLDGMVLCGGYPELYAEKLGNNTALLQELRTAITVRKLPTIAECGGFLLLHRSLDGVPMTDVCGGDAVMGDRLQQFGYVTLTAARDSLLCRKGETLTAHEFHYAQSTQPGTFFAAKKPGGNRGWRCVHASDTLHAGYPHIHFAGNLPAAKRFLQACAKYHQEENE